MELNYNRKDIFCQISTSNLPRRITSSRFFYFFLANIGDFSNLRYWQYSFKISYKFFFFLFNTFFITFFLNIVFNMASKIILPYVPLVIVLNTKSDAVVITILKPPWLRVLTQQNLLVHRRFCLILSIFALTCSFLVF